MTNPPGTFIWYELLTTDPDAADRFYADVVGWTIAPFDGAAGADGAMDYRIATMPTGGIGGIAKTPDPAMPPGWFGYIGVDDVDAAVRAAEQAGGTIKMPAFDLPGVGRMAMLADPAGALFYVMRGASEQSSNAFDRAAPGHCSWHEIATDDVDATLAFYTGRFGWAEDGVMDMGPMGGYHFLADASGQIGATMRRVPGMPPPRWSFYFRVPGIAAAAERIVAGGGRIVMGPHEIPTGEWIVAAADPQGAAFALVGPKG